jgi:hypothetical protein
LQAERHGECCTLLRFTFAMHHSVCCVCALAVSAFELQGSLLDTTGDLNSMAMGGVDRFVPLIFASKFEVTKLYFCFLI